MKWCTPACALALLLVPVRASTGKPTSAEDAFQLVSTRLVVDDNDESNARLVEGLQPAERLADDAIQVLKAAGAGPRTARALDELRARSSNLPSPPQPVVAIEAGLDAEQQKAILGRITEYASGYVSTLPNMSCTQTTRFARIGKESGILGSRKPQAKLADGWRLEDTIVQDLDYYQGTETYHTRKLNGATETKPVTQLRSSFSQGELGSVLAMTFAPASQARFEWDHWESVRGRRVAVFSYSIDQPHSQYWVCCVSTGSMTVNGLSRPRYKRWLSAYRGSVYADAETGSIARFTFRNVDIPAEYNLQDARNLLDYSTVMLGGKSFWLPVRAIHYTRTAEFRARDEIQFVNYRKFDADTTIQFPTDEK